MVQLPNNCYCSDLKVNPSNWKSIRSSCKKDWYIYYRFYDPDFKAVPKYKKGKLILIKGMNTFTDGAERREATRKIIDFELDRLLINGYNPITGQYKRPFEVAYEIEPSTPFIEALRLSLGRLTLEPATVADMKSILKYFEIAAIETGLDKLFIGDVKRKHIKMVLLQAGRNKGGWTAVNFNKYRRYISILMKELVQLDAIEHNPVRDVEKMKGLRKIRTVLADEERVRVVEHLANSYPEFLRFVQIFFHSGSRRNEMMRLRVKDVDLKQQRYKVVIKKGRESREVYKVIKDIALEFWTELLNGADKEDFVFSVGLCPGPKQIRPDQITRRWEYHVKKKLGITADFYSLKHLNTTEVVEALGEVAAANLNSQTSTAMVKEIYDVDAEKRKIKSLLSIRNRL